ncbi:hypothetical protein L208DRAFT_1375377 [Tricholoma matsutake]|nr:hypothetical protein L208DRAFT_1375377 [Tricholoma matsutake 945]
MCLPFHNCYYMEVKLNAHELMMLQEDAMPEWTIQEFVETRDMMDMNKAFEGYVQCIADGKWAIGHGIKCFDNQPGFYCLLLETFQDSGNLSQYFGRIVKVHREITNKENAQEAAGSFDQLIEALISHILHGGAELFRKTLAYLGKVERREGTMLAFEMLLFHHPHSGLRAVETTLAMTSINEFKGGTQWQKIEAEVQGCQNITDDSRLVMVYMTREPGFGNWNFLEFTLGAVEGRMYGLEHAVNRHTVMQGWCQW